MVDGNPLVGMTLYGGGRRVKLWIEGGIKRLRELSASPSSLFWAGGGPGRYGDGEPDFAFNEQRTWEGGRGLESFVDDPTGYLDSLNGWSLTPGFFGPSPQWFFGRGYRPNGADFSLPGDVTWQPIYGNTRYISRSFTPTANITADKAYLWIRRVGSPGTLTLELCSDSAGNPGSVLKTATITTSNVTDVISVLQAFDWTTTQALTGGTTYHLKVYGAAADDAAKHWQMAVDVTSASSKYSSDDSTYNTAGYSAYYRVVGADVKASHKLFVLDNVMYAVSQYRDGTASRLWMNGKRGIATAGAATSLTDSNGAFGTSNEYVGARVKIIRGTGFGQTREITAHTGTVLTVATWDINPDNTSVYYIYQTPRFTEITSTGLGVVQSVAVYNNVAHFGHVGSGDPIRRIRFDTSIPGHDFCDDSTNEANHLETGYLSATPGRVLWRGINTAGQALVSNAPAVAWSTDHTFGTGIATGDGSYPITGLLNVVGNNASRCLVFTTGEFGYIDNAKWYRNNLQIDSILAPTNGQGAISHGLYTAFPWANSLELLYGEALDDVDPNRGGGFPIERQGVVSCLAAHPIGFLVGIDAGDTGYSSVLFLDTNTRTYHEIYRAHEVGKRVKDVFFQSNDGGKMWLWISVGDDLVYMQFPVRNPFKDTSQTYMHEWVLTTAALDMGNSSIFKAWKDLTLITKNLDGIGVYAELDYQLDGEIGGATWRRDSDNIFKESPSATIALFKGENKQIAFRIRAFTNDASTPPLMVGMVAKGVGQLPSKFDDSFWVLFGNISETVGGGSIEDMNLIIEGSDRARIWEIIDCDYKAIVGKRVLANIVEVDPEYNINNKDNVRAQIHLSGLG